MVPGLKSHDDLVVVYYVPVYASTFSHLLSPSFILYHPLLSSILYHCLPRTTSTNRPVPSAPFPSSPLRTLLGYGNTLAAFDQERQEEEGGGGGGSRGAVRGTHVTTRGGDGGDGGDGGETKGEGTTDMDVESKDDVSASPSASSPPTSLATVAAETSLETRRVLRGLVMDGKSKNYSV